MIQGIYLASMGMTPLIDKQDQIANNLANIQTTGYKQSGTFLKSYEKYLSNDQKQPFANAEIKTDQTYTDYSPGTMQKTDNPLDLYIQGNGFLTMMTSSGIRYSRNGNLSIDSDGFIVSGDGAKVMGTEGYIKIDKRQSVQFSEDGEVLQQGTSLGKLRIADFNKPYQLLREGNGYLRPSSIEGAVGGASNYSIKSGYLEASNVNVVQNMVNMISTYRNYEADQKAVNAQDETLEKAVDQVGKVG